MKCNTDVKWLTVGPGSTERAVRSLVYLVIRIRIGIVRVPVPGPGLTRPESGDPGGFAQNNYFRMLSVRQTTQGVSERSPIFVMNPSGFCASAIAVGPWGFLGISDSEWRLPPRVKRRLLT